MTLSTAAIVEGASVVGTYMGVPYAATVDSTRGHTINPDMRLTFVTLTAPMGGEFAGRTSLCVTTAYDGSSRVDSRGFDDQCTVVPV